MRARSRSRISEKFAGTRSIVPAAKHGRVTCDRKYEHVTEAVAGRAVQVRPVVQRVHLVDAHAA